MPQFLGRIGDPAWQWQQQIGVDVLNPDGPSTGIATVVVTIPRALAAPVVITRGLNPWSRTSLVTNRAINRTTVVTIPRALPAPVVVSRALRQRLDTEAKYRRAIKSFTVIASRPLNKPPAVFTRVLRNRLDTEAKERRAIKTFAIKQIPARATFPSPTRATYLHAPLSLADGGLCAFVFVVDVPTPLPIPTVRYTGALRQRLDTEAKERHVAKRTMLRVPTSLPQPTIRLSNFPPYQRFVPAVVERYKNRTRVVAIPQSLPAPRGLWAGGIPYGERDRVPNRIVISLTRPYTAVAAPRVIHRTLPLPGSDGGLVQVTTFVVVPFTPSAPVVKQARPVWKLAPAATPTERVRSKITVIPAIAPNRPARTTTNLLRQRLDTEARERTPGTANINTFRAPTSLPAARVRSMALRNRLDTEAKERRVAKRINIFAIPASPRARPTPQLYIWHAVEPHEPQMLMASGAWGWAWEFKGTATVVSVGAATPTSQVVGFNEKIGRPQQTAGI